MKKHYDDAAAVISFILFIVIVLMNGIVIYALIFKEHKRSRLLYFVLHLAIADLSVGIFNVLGDGIQSAMNGEWHGGDILCKLWRYSKIVTMIGSNNILIGMSIDRFLAIRYPLNTVRLGGWRYLNKTLVISAWVISFVVASYTLKYAKGINAVPTAETFIEQKGSCDIIMSAEWLWKPYVIMYMLGVYIIPTIIITICYIGICLVIWNNLKAGMKLTEMNKKTNNGNLQDGADLHSGLLPKAKIRSVKMTVVICIGKRSSSVGLRTLLFSYLTSLTVIVWILDIP
ncbi:Vasopressin receptor [Mactra antiquata]